MKFPGEWTVYNGHIVTMTADEVCATLVCRRENESGVTRFEAFIEAQDAGFVWYGQGRHEATMEVNAISWNVCKSELDAMEAALNYVTGAHTLGTQKN